MNQPTFSIILPLYKQNGHAALLVKNYIDGLKILNDSWEILFIINGPEDGTEKSLKEIVGQDQRIKIFRLEKGGWGRAVKFGLQKSTGKYLCYTNSARTSIAELIRVLLYAKVNEDTLVKATRIVRQEWFRRIGSIFYNFENRALFKTPVWDVNGTPKVIPRKIMNSINLVREDDLIDAELLAKCNHNKFPIIEIPIAEKDRISGKSTTTILSGIKMYWGLWRLKQKMKSG